MNKRALLLAGGLLITGTAIGGVRKLKNRVDMLRFKLTYFWPKAFSNGMATVRVFLTIDNHHEEPFLLDNLLVDVSINTDGGWEPVGNNKPWRLREKSPLDPTYDYSHPLDFPRGSKQLEIDIDVTPAMFAAYSGWFTRPDRAIKVDVSAKLPGLPMVKETLEMEVPTIIPDSIRDKVGGFFDGLSFQSIKDRLGMGFVPAEIRSVYPRDDFYQYYPGPEHLLNDSPLKLRGNTYDTLELMLNKVPEWAWQTEKIAQYLKGRTFEETLRNIFYFHVNHIKFVEDEGGEEQKSPLQTFHLGYGDCNDLSMSQGTMLYNLGIPFGFRKSAYSNPNGKVIHKTKGIRSNGWQHVYVWVKKPGGKEYILDFNLGEFNVEKPYLDKVDVHL